MLRRDLAEEWLPPALYRRMLVRKEQSRFHAFSAKEIFSGNEALKGIKRGKRAFLLATGPSIKRENLKCLAGADCYSLSNFFLHEQIGLINPRFHFFAPYHQPLILENYVQWLDAADRALPSATAIFLGHTTIPIVQEHRLFRDREVRYLYLAQYPDRRGVDISKPVLSPQSGPLMILPVLLYMGYRTVYLLGCDHNNLKDYKKPMEHFYPAGKDLRMNASDENAWDDVTSTMWQAYNLFSQYDFYKKLYQRQGSKIINLSSDSWLNMFPTESLEQIRARRS